MEYHSATRKKKILPFVTTWIDLENIMLSESHSNLNITFEYNRFKTSFYVKLLLLFCAQPMLELFFILGNFPPFPKLVGYEFLCLPRQVANIIEIIFYIPTFMKKIGLLLFSSSATTRTFAKYTLTLKPQFLSLINILWSITHVQSWYQCLLALPLCLISKTGYFLL